MPTTDSLNRFSIWLPRWLIAVVTTTFVTGVLVRLAVDRLAREAPNFTQIEDGLFMGGHVSDPPPGTRAVLNLDENQDRYTADVYRWEPIPDAEPAPDISWLRRQVEFIAAQRRAGKPVFVRCRNGVSRSGMVLVAYEMFEHSCSRDEALTIVRRMRPAVRPHPAFMSALLDWEQALKSPAADDNASRTK